MQNIQQMCPLLQSCMMSAGKSTDLGWKQLSMRGGVAVRLYAHGRHLRGSAAAREGAGGALLSPCAPQGPCLGRMSLSDKRRNRRQAGRLWWTPAVDELLCFGISTCA
jgi:hypothetical protein